MRFQSTTMIRAIDQLVHEPSGVCATMHPKRIEIGGAISLISKCGPRLTKSFIVAISDGMRHARRFRQSPLRHTGSTPAARCQSRGKEDYGKSWAKYDS